MLSITLFVDDSSTATTPDGLAWATAYDDLQSALTQAATLNTDGDTTNDVDAIWIAEGTYRPSAELEPGDTRSASFSLLDGVTIYGGFTGTETTLAERDLFVAHTTILSGDLGIIGDTSDNAYTVVYCAEGNKAAIDCILITGGNANGTGDTGHGEQIVGGGIYNCGDLSVTNSSIADNSADYGGGIYSIGTLNLTNSTISGNLADNNGGGIYNEYTGGITITNSTLVDNASATNAGGIINWGVTVLNNTVVARNSASSNDPDVYDANGRMTGCHNLIGEGGHMTSLTDGVNGNQVGTSEVPIDPLLGPLQDNGGPTPTHAPLPGSPLIDMGNDTVAVNSLGRPFVADQRGFQRKFGTVDIGAVEQQPLGVPVACDDIFGLDQGNSITIEISELLANDTCNDGSIPTVEILSDPKHGTLVTNPDGTITYTPDKTFWGTDSFSYQTFNGSLESNEADVILSVVSPQSVIVTIADDEQDGNLSADDISLREAVEDLQASQIQFSINLIDQDVHLTKGQLGISDVQIVGLGVTHLVVIANRTYPYPGFNASGGDSIITDLTVTSDGSLAPVEIKENATLLLDHVSVCNSQSHGIHNQGTLTVSGCTISNNAVGGIQNIGGTLVVTGSIITGNYIEGFGGGIFNDQGSVTITTSTISNNVTDSGTNFSGGGGIYNSDGTLIIADSTISGNIAGSLTGNSDSYSGGGGIYNRCTSIDSDAVLTITNSIIIGNVANGTNAYCGGGGIYNSGIMNMTGSTLADNSAQRDGGGTLNKDTLTITDSTIANNSGGTEGGGIYNIYGTLVLQNSTLSSNSAINGGGIASGGTSRIVNTTLSGNSALLSYPYDNGKGGGIYLCSGTLTVVNSTLTNNSSRTGGGIYNDATTPAVLDNTVIAGNTASVGVDIYCNRALLEGTNNLIGNGYSDQFLLNGVDGNIVGTPENPIDPMLGPLQDNGGPTLTHAPLPGSPLLDAGNDAKAVTPIGWSYLTDQRGFLRAYGTVDIGAVEDQPEGVPIASTDAFELDQDGSLTFDATDLLANDTCNEEIVLTAEILTDPQHGTLTTNPNGTITYTPEEGFWGTDSFTYRALNGSLQSNVADVVLSIISPESVIVTIAEDESDGNYSADDISLREALGALGASRVQFSTDLLGQALIWSSYSYVSDVHIVGLGSEHLVINRKGTASTFYFHGLDSTISDLMITANATSDVFNITCCITSPAIVIQQECVNLLLDRVVLKNDGGVTNMNGTLTVQNSVISGNSANYGSGIRNGGMLTITDSTLTDNESDFGGVISNAGEMTIINSTIEGNKANLGGAIHNIGEVTIRNSTIQGNEAYEGGAIYSESPEDRVSQVVIVDSTISDNTGGSGGGICIQDSTLTVMNSTISENKAGRGGAIYIQKEEGESSLTLIDSTIYNNSATTWGGGIYSANQDYTATIEIRNSTFSGNSASHGGGIYTNSSRDILTITNSTLSKNSAGSSGGGIYCAISRLTLNNTVVAGNKASLSSPDILAFYSPDQVTGSHNFIGDGADQSLIDGVDGNQIGTSDSPLDPMLGPLQDNGGPTLTHAPLPGSPLVDAGSDMLATDSIGWSLLTDQRGLVRKFGTVDIGAVETQPEGTPVAYDDIFELQQDDSISFALSELLANDDCYVECILTTEIVSQPKHGTLITNPDGTITYMPDESFWGTDSFTYRALNGSLESNVAEVVLSVISPQSIIVTTTEGWWNNLPAGVIDLGRALNMAGVSQVQFSSDLFKQVIPCSASYQYAYNVSDIQVVGLGSQHLAVEGIKDGGAIFTATGGSSIISDLMITGSIESQGIAVWQEATVRIDNTLISNISGSGIFNWGTLTINNSTISGNSNNYTYPDAGGICNYRGDLYITNSIIMNNSTTLSGGGIYNYEGNLTISNSTITGNSAGAGGGIFCKGSESSITLNNTIVASNTNVSGGPDLSVHSGTLSGSHNLIGDGTNQTLVDGVNGNQVGTSDSPIDPMLDDSGVPSVGSPVIDAGNNVLIPSGITTDLAGNARIFNGTVDIGAYESDASKYVPGDANRDGRVDGSDVTILAANWQHGVTSTPDATWSMGDFNYDGKVDGSDVTILAANWQYGVSSTVVAVSDPEPNRPPHFTPPVTASLVVATVPQRESLLPRRRFITPTPKSTDVALAESALTPDFRTRGLSGTGVPYLLEYGDKNDQKAEGVH